MRFWPFSKLSGHVEPRLLRRAAIDRSDDRALGATLFGVLSHEGAHTLTGKLESTLQTECQKQKEDCGDLWHATLFYTVGEVVKKKALAERGAFGYVPYADKFGLYARGAWPGCRAGYE